VIYQLIWFAFMLFSGLRMITPGLSLDARGPVIWINALSTLVLYTYILLIAFGLGRKAARFFPNLTRLESSLLSLLIGLGGIADGVLFIGLAGFLNIYVLFVGLAALGLYASYEWKAMVGEWLDILRQLKNISHQKFSPYQVIVFAIVIFWLFLLPLMALAPVKDYDALMYHLEIPRQFLAHGRIYFDSNMWRSAFPMLNEMLFLIGVAFHLESFAQLISLTFSLALVASIYAFSVRFFNRTVALLAVGIFLGNPVFPVYATVPGVDYSWACYEFWSIFALTIWLLSPELKDRNRWLFLVGLLSGFAASVKYLALPTMLILGLIVLWKSFSRHKGTWSQIGLNLALFGFPAALIISPWYLKSWIWTGNPFYPFLFGGSGWTSARQALYSEYMYSFGAGRGLLDFLLLPYNLYRHLPGFSTISLEIFHPLLWLAVGFIAIKGWRKFAHILVYIFFNGMFWALSVQQLRFLTPLIATLSIFSAVVLSRFSRVLKIVLTLGVVVGLMLVTVIYQLRSVADTQLFAYLSGQMSKSEYLSRNLYDFKATEFIQKNLQPSDRVLFLWSGAAYYCDARCIPDSDEFLALALAQGSPNPETLAHQLRAEGITHILLSRPNAYWFISLHDPNGNQRAALNYFEKTFIPHCAQSIYADSPLELFQLTCP